MWDRRPRRSSPPISQIRPILQAFRALMEWAAALTGGGAGPTQKTSETKSAGIRTIRVIRVPSLAGRHPWLGRIRHGPKVPLRGAALRPLSTASQTPEVPATDPMTVSALAGTIRTRLADRLPGRRFTHVMGVEGLAVALARQWGVDAEKVLLAALLHDYMKAEKKETLRALLDSIEDFPVTDEDRQHENIWHGQVAAQVAKAEFGVTCREIRDAVFFHTTGRAGLGPVGLVLYVADTREPTRTFPGVEQARRRILPLGLKEAALEVSTIKLDLLLQKKHPIHSLTLGMKEWLAGQTNRISDRGEPVATC